RNRNRLHDVYPAVRHGTPRVAWTARSVSAQPGRRCGHTWNAGSRLDWARRDTWLYASARRRSRVALRERRDRDAGVHLLTRIVDRGQPSGIVGLLVGEYRTVDP